MRRSPFVRSLLPGVALALTSACAPAPSASSRPNAFLDESIEDGKADTGYLNPDGIEVEVDLEADIAASSYGIDDAPASSAQYALTVLRTSGTFYIESIAEDSSQASRVEWLIDGAWKTAAQARTVPADKKTHFRLRAINAVLLNSAKNGVTAGKTFTAPVPRRPLEVMSAAGKSCATEDDHIALGQSVYWYLWNPAKTTCKVDKVDMKITVSKMFATMPTVYPEYDRLMADKKLTAVVLFGQIGDGALVDTDPGIEGAETMEADLEAAGFVRKTAPLGVRMEKALSGGRSIQVDLYNARVFSGLGDEANFDNFQKALSEHELVAYDGHSMLGASDFWARPTYHKDYQIFLYGGCLGYQYYVRPIVDGKDGWNNLDLVSSVIEVTADANEFAAPAMNKIFRSVQSGPKSSWRSILTQIRSSVGDSTFGVSGVRDNCWSPSGSRCK